MQHVIANFRISKFEYILHAVSEVCFMMLHSFMSRSFIHGHTPKFTVNITPRFLGHNCLRFYATSNINPQGSERGEREKSGRNTASKRDQEWNNNADKGKRSGENRYVCRSSIEVLTHR